MFIRALTLSLVFALPALAADYAADGKSSITVGKDAEGNATYTTLTTSYTVIHDYSGDADAPMLLKKAVQRTETANHEGFTGKVQLEVRGSAAKPFDHKLWDVVENASEAAPIEDGVLITWLEGCCGSRTGYRALNAKTGRLLVSYDDGQASSPDITQVLPLVVEVPNTQPALLRFIGVVSADSTRDFKAGKTADGLAKIATLTYSGLEGKIEKFDLFGKTTENYAMTVSTKLVDISNTHKNEARQNRLTLWTSDGLSDPKKALNDFAVKITLEDDRTNEITIPFTADRADQSRAVLPAGFRLVPVN